MPVMTPKPTAPAYPADSPVQIAKPQYKGTTVDTTVVPVTQLLTHIEGSSWTVNYFSQVLDQDMDTVGQGLASPAVQQQYRKVSQLELKVTSPLAYAQDAESKNSDLKGTAVMYPPVIPNQGDMFTGDIGAGREAILEVISSRKLSIFKMACYEIEYKVIAYSSPTDGRLADLESKVVQSTVFVKDFMTYGQNPILFEEEYDHLVYIRRRYRTIVDQYLRSFMSNEFKVLCVPDQSSPTYDPYLVKAIKQLFLVEDSQAMYEMRELNVQDDEAYKAFNVWDALLKRDQDYMSSAFAQFGMVKAYDFTSDPMYEGIRWSGIENVIYPVDPSLTVDYRVITPAKMVSTSKLEYPTVKMKMSDLLKVNKPLIRDMIPGDSLGGFVGSNADDTPAEQMNVVPPVVHPSMQDGYYIFSKAFYENSQVPGAQSQLELMVRDFLEHKALSLKSVRALAENIGEWNTISRFYYVPVVVILMRASLRGI